MSPLTKWFGDGCIALQELNRRYLLAVERLDAVHASDPRPDPIDDSRPYELVYAERMSAWLQRLAPAASEPLRLAVRAQHLGRWRLPRDRYPVGRAGYHRWRREQARRQADAASAILAKVGYEPATCERVAALIRKEGLRYDPETQTLEDCACLVFLQYYLSGFAQRYDKQKLANIVRKTWNKMSEFAREQALTLPLDEAVERALWRPENE